MSLFRSEKMGLYNLIMPYESAWNILNCIDFNFSLIYLRIGRNFSFTFLRK